MLGHNKKPAEWAGVGGLKGLGPDQIREVPSMWRGL